MKTAILITLALAAGGCDPKTRDPTPLAQAVNGAANGAADNTGKNVRDRGSETLTPGDQGGSEVDRTITQQIRQGVMKQETLSMTAKNVKIITVEGVVTLRGPVKSDEEKALIASLARQTGNVKRVDNQLEIAAN